MKEIVTKVKGDVWARMREKRMTDDRSQPATDWRTVTLTLHEGQRTGARRKKYSEKKERVGNDQRMNDHQLR